MQGRERERRAGGREGRSREARAACGRRHGLADAGAGRQGAREKVPGDSLLAKGPKLRPLTETISSPARAARSSPARTWLPGLCFSRSRGASRAAATKLGRGGCCEWARRRGARGRSPSSDCSRRAPSAPRRSRQVVAPSARTAPNLPAKAASATVQASSPRHGVMVRAARTPRAEL